MLPYMSAIRRTSFIVHSSPDRLRTGFFRRNRGAFNFTFYYQFSILLGGSRLCLQSSAALSPIVGSPNGNAVEGWWLDFLPLFF